MFNYLNFICYHPSNPERKVNIEAFGPRGAKIKARRILASMGIISKEESLENIKVREG